MKIKPIRILQISDTHLFSNKNNNLLGVNTFASCQAVLELAKTNKVNPDFILLSGDIAQDGSNEAYVHVDELLSIMNVPVYCVPGNHDDLVVMKKIYTNGLISLEKQLIFDEWQLILLDSQKHKSVGGYLNTSELSFMTACLNQYPQHRAIIVFHHQPIQVESEWLDKVGLKNSDAFWASLANFPQVHTILFGHVHQLIEGNKDKIKYYSTPATCIQFKPKSQNFALDNVPPAYRIIDLFPNGDLETSVHRLDKYIGEFMKDAKGY